MSDPVKIKGYRDLSKDEIQSINSIKTHGDELRTQIDALVDTHPDINTVWLVEGERFLQLGLMCLCRAVAKPEGF